MQQQEGIKKFLPHLIVIGIFLALSCIFSYPAFQGKTLDQHDVKTWLWMSKESRDYHAQTGESALWANNMFSGMPQVQTDYYAETNWFRFFNRIFLVTSPTDSGNPTGFFFIAMVSFYILASTMRINRWLGVIGAIAFAFSTYNPIIITAGHTTKFLNIAYFPAIMAGMIIAYRGRYLAGAALAGVFLAFFFDANHIQIIYYCAFVVAVMVVAALVVALKRKELKRWLFASVALGLAAAFAIATSASRLIQTKEYNPFSTRGGASELTQTNKQKDGGLDKDYAFQWSNGVDEVLTILVPNLYSAGAVLGEDSHYGEVLGRMGLPPQQVEQMTANAPLYWGPQTFLSGAVYFGAVICLLFVLSLFVIRSKHKWWLAGLCLFFALLSMGDHFKPLNYFMFDYFPLYNKFRSPNMALTIPSIIFPIMAIWALKEIFEEKITKEELWKKLKSSLIITGGLCLVLLIATQSIYDYKGINDGQIEKSFGEQAPVVMKAIREDRSAGATKDALRSLLFVALAGGILWAYAKDKTNKKMAIAGLGLLVTVDILPVANRYLGDRNFVDTDAYWSMNFEPSPADQQILRDQDPYYRVLNLTTSSFNDSKTSFFHKSVGGYHGAKMETYQDLIEAQLQKLNGQVLNMLNTKYFIVPGQRGEEMVYPNPAACGNAWFVNEIKWVKNADDEMNALNAAPFNNPTDTAAGNFQPLHTAVLRDTFRQVIGAQPFGKDAEAYVRLAPNGYGPRRIKFESQNSQDGFAVFSDIYYPLGWKATIDGKEVPIARVNYVLRGLRVPAGKHTIEFSFNPPSYETGERVALFGSILLTALIIAGLVFTFRQTKKQTTNA